MKETAMKNVYEVRYEAVVVDRPSNRGVWVRNENPIRVVANGSVESAVKKAKTYLLKSRTTWTDEEGVRRLTFNRRVKITSCERVVSDVIA